MKLLTTYILSFLLWTNALAVDFDKIYGGLEFNMNNVEFPDSNINIEPSPDPLDDLSEEERALMMAAEQLAQNRADCDDGKGGIEVGIIDVVRLYPKEDGSSGYNEVPEKVDCNQVALLEYKLLEDKLGSDKAYECTTKNWYIDEKVAFAKELQLPMEKHFCKEKSEARKKQTMTEKAIECGGSFACTMLKLPGHKSMSNALGFEPIQAVVDWALGDDSDFAKGCKDSPGEGCLSTVIWGFFKNTFENIKGIKDLAVMIGNGVVEGAKWVAGKAADAGAWVAEKGAGVINWWGDKLFGSKPLEDFENKMASRQQVISQQEDGFFKEFLTSPVKTTGNLLSSLFSGIMDLVVEGAKSNFMCGGEYYTQNGDLRNASSAEAYHSLNNRSYKDMGDRALENVANFNNDHGASRHEKIRCDQPFIKECASCGQWTNMACGIIGVLGSEVAVAALTGGTVNVAAKSAKGVAAAGRVVSNIMKSSSKWDDIAKLSKGAKGSFFKGLDNLKGSFSGQIEKISEFSFRGMASNIGKSGKNLIFSLGDRVFSLGPKAGNKLLAALKKGREMGMKGMAKATLKAPFKIAGKTIKTGYVVSKGYLKLLDDAFIFGMQGKQGLKMARMAQESQRIRKELKGLQAAADRGDEAAKALVRAHEKRLQLLEDHQKLTKSAMKSKTKEQRDALLAQAQSKADELDDSVENIARAKSSFDAEQAEKIRLAKQSDNATGSSVVNNSSNGTSGTNVANNADNAVSPGRNYGNYTEDAARTGTRNTDTVTLSRKPASLKVDDVVKANPKIRERVTELSNMKGPNGVRVSETQQSFVQGILNNADAATREKLIKKIADDGWDSIRRSCN